MKGMPYGFDYAVNDQYTGTDFSQTESSDGNVVTGEYRVLLPDGRTQIVTYTADHENGFVADVRYEGEAQYPQGSRIVDTEGSRTIILGLGDNRMEVTVTEDNREIIMDLVGSRATTVDMEDNKIITGMEVRKITVATAAMEDNRIRVEASSVAARVRPQGMAGRNSNDSSKLMIQKRY